MTPEEPPHELPGTCKSVEIKLIKKIQLKNYKSRVWKNSVLHVNSPVRNDQYQTFIFLYLLQIWHFFTITVFAEPCLRTNECAVLDPQAHGYVFYT